MNGNGSVSFGNDKMRGGGCDVLRMVWYGMEWNGIFSGVKAVRRVYALDGSCVCMCPFPFSFFLCLDDVRVLRCMEGGLVCCSLCLLMRNGEGDGVR
jgi:hypothetical protein